ncbi:hypothetical protein KSP40_PGU015598 [Platanthera guangdongensis]|uniref:Uncharacterized protein n=1 Tax=Platanthera guangdongensis TaxID=2320717 RepID=A0ABR2MKK7_9ASPA
MARGSSRTTFYTSANRRSWEGLRLGVIALILYKFTTTVEAALNRHTISDSFSR